MSNIKFIENGKIGHPAIALVAIRKRKIKDGSGCGRAGIATVQAGYVRAVALIPACEPKEAKRALLYCVTANNSSDWRKNWRIAHGTIEGATASVMHFQPLGTLCECTQAAI